MASSLVSHFKVMICANGALIEWHRQSGAAAQRAVRSGQRAVPGGKPIEVRSIDPA